MKKTFFLLCVLTVLVLALAACGTAGKENSGNPTADPTEQTAASSNKTYTVTFNCYGGSEVPAQNVGKNERIDLPDEPQKTGYSFNGWFYFDWDGVYRRFTDQPIRRNMTLYADWRAVEYPISIVNSDGNGQNYEIMYTIASRDVTLRDPVRYGYDFLGWTWEGQSTPQKDPVIKQGSTGAKTFVANWSEPIVYTITYDLAGGSMETLPGPSFYTVESDTITFTDVPTKEDCVFGCWIVEKQDDQYPRNQSQYEILQGSTGNQIVKATWRDIFTFSGNTVTGLHDWEKNIDRIEIPNKINGVPVTGIGDSAFMDCVALKSVSIPNGVTSIGSAAFLNCVVLESVTIGSGVSEIGELVFGSCPQLTNVTVSSENPYYHMAGNCLIETESKTLIWGCKNSVIPTDGSETEIGRSAFENCADLVDITIPDTVTSIGNSAFANCKALQSITIPSEIDKIYFSTFWGCYALTEIHFKGTIAQWNAIEKAAGWDEQTGAYTVHCTDGDISK